MRDKNKSVKSKTRKRPLISAIIGAAIALFTIICCGILVPLGLFTAAAFLHQWRIPLIILGIATAAISIFFLLKGKEIICVCKAFDIMRKHKKLIISSLCIILCVSLISIFLSGNFFRPSTSDSTDIITSEWKNSKVESDLVRVVDFLKNNKGKEIELAGEKHVITGKEELSIKVVMLECCTKREFDDILGSLSKIGVVRSSDFDKKEIQADIPVDEIPKIADIWNVERIDFEPEARIFWMQMLNH
ncbi:MAG: hypothetical protein KKA61_02925 [Nanoarchaeota archaeon]|nr:hypothetical protein [Nanoarchaeota archaeon]MBU4493300.1 hypothetical protein [Nanoarchaeota archaeon]